MPQGRAYRRGIWAVVAVGLTVPVAQVRSQAPAAQRALVIQGGTIVDVRQGTLVPNSVVVIQGDRIAQVGTAGQVTVPAGAEVVNADGKFVMPGIWDTHAHTRPFDAILNINHGVTSTIDLGNILDWISVVKEARDKGMVAGPRIFFQGMSIAGNLGPHQWAVKSVEEAVWSARKNIEYGASLLKIYHFGTPEIIKAVADEAHRAGVKLSGHLTVADAREAILAGMDHLIHGSGIAAATSPPEASKRIRNRRDDPELRRLGYSAPNSNYLQDPAMFDDLIKLMIERGTTMEPNIIAMFKGVYPQAHKFMAEGLELALTQDIRAPETFLHAWAEEGSHARSGPPTPDLIDKLKKGLANHQLFTRKFVAAGGKIFVGTDAWHIVPPGLAVWHEMELLADAGVPPLAILQGATINPAEFVNQGDKLGTIEQGKLADIIILGRNPLQDVMNIRSLETVIQHGRIQPRGYKNHTYYANPFPRPFYATSGVLRRPYLTTASPAVVSVNSEEFVLTITGKDFDEENEVYWEDTGLEVRKVGPTEIQAVVPADLLRRVGTYKIHMWSGGHDPQGPSLNSVSVIVSYGRKFENRWNGQTRSPEF